MTSTRLVFKGKEKEGGIGYPAVPFLPSSNSPYASWHIQVTKEEVAHGDEKVPLSMGVVCGKRTTLRRKNKMKRRSNGCKSFKMDKTLTPLFRPQKPMPIE